METKHGYETAQCANYGLLKDKAKEHRKNSTEAERIFWSLVKGKTLGVRFRRQHIIDNFIVDFACLPLKLIVELDGGYHFTAEQMEMDRNRSFILNKLGFTVIRFTNEEIIGNTEHVVNILKDTIQTIQKDNKTNEEATYNEPINTIKTI